MVSVASSVAKAAALLAPALTAIALLAAALAASPLAPLARRMGALTMTAALLGGTVALWRLRRARRRGPARTARRALLTAWTIVACATPVLLASTFASPCEREEVVFESSDARLAATLYLPDGDGPHPGVVLVHGSTRQTRDSFLGLYRSAAEELATRGVAALVYDKRGCGDSTGDYASALLTDLAADAAAGARWLASRPETDPERVGVWGLSQGGWVAPLAARAEPAVRFVVIVSAAATSEGEQRLHEWSSRLAGEGVPPEHVAELCDLQRLIWQYYRTGEGWPRVRTAWQDAQERPWWPYAKPLENPGPAPPDQVSSAAGRRSLRWHRTDMARDPLPILAALDVPVLAIHGGADDVIPAAESHERIAAVLQRKNDGHSRALWYPHAAHPLIEARIPPAYPQGYFEAVARWIRAAAER